MSVRFPPAVLAVAKALEEAGGEAYAVGGCVRDVFTGATTKDWDLEVRLLSPEKMRSVLSGFGEVHLVGESHGIYKVSGLPGIDIGIPRKDRKSGKGHGDFEHTLDPEMSLFDAGVRRDFTFNAMYQRVLTGEFHDPHGGLRDLRAKKLRAVNEQTFIEDPLRMLRAVQFCARLGVSPDPHLHHLLLAMVERKEHLNLSKERVYIEFQKIVMSADPARGLFMLEDYGMLDLFPQLHALVDVEQDPHHHPEGRVYLHSCYVLAEMAGLLAESETLCLDETPLPEALRWAALFHDLGKAATTKFEDGKWRAKGHEEAGEAPIREFFRLFPGADAKLIDRVVVLTRHHLAPVIYPAQNAGRKAYLRVARDLFAVDLTMGHLFLVSTADQFGRTTPKALAKTNKAENFIDKCAKYKVWDTSSLPVEDVKRMMKGAVDGDFLLARGFKQGKELGAFLKKCLAFQDETGVADAETIFNCVQAGWEPVKEATTC